MLDRPQDPLAMILEDTTAQLNAENERESFAPKQDIAVPEMDIGAQNMSHAGELSIRAMRESAKETAKRARALAKAAREEGERIAADF